MKTDYFQIHTKLNCDVEEIMNVIASTSQLSKCSFKGFVEKIHHYLPTIYGS